MYASARYHQPRSRDCNLLSPAWVSSQVLMCCLSLHNTIAIVLVPACAVVRLHGSLDQGGTDLSRRTPVEQAKHHKTHSPECCKCDAVAAYRQPAMQVAAVGQPVSEVSASKPVSTTFSPMTTGTTAPPAEQSCTRSGTGCPCHNSCPCK